MRLHGYWRSSAAYRVRIALNLKGLAYAQSTHDLRTGAQRAPAYLSLNPQGLVPAVEMEGQVIGQSLAILEWLEEAHPTPALLPVDVIDRAIVRSMAALIACDVHPLHNLRVLKALKRDAQMDETHVSRWASGWIQEGLAALEPAVRQHGQGFAFGATPTMADCCLVPQLYSAERFGVDLSAYPAVVAAGEAARALPEIAAAHPSVQPDADGAPG